VIGSAIILIRGVGFALISSMLVAAYAAPPVVTGTVRNQRLQKTLDTALDTARRAYDIPAMTAMIVEGDAVVATSTRGVRAVGEAALATSQDQWLIGSCGKIMTATMIMRLVDRGVLSLDAPLPQLLPTELVALMHPDTRKMTLAHLLSHTSGLDEDSDLFNGVPQGLQSRFNTIADPLTRAQMRVASLALQRKPQTQPGVFFQYSNFGYIVAGVAASHITGKSWRQLMADEVFTPLAMSGAGFGIVGSAARLDQPRGHEATWKWVVVPHIRAINPDHPKATLPLFYEAAGLIHLTMVDWGKFLVMLNRGYHAQSNFLSTGSFARLLEPVTAKNYKEYALGVQVTMIDAGKHTLYSHTGSDGYWRARFRLNTKTNQILMMAANLGSDDVDRAFDAIAKQIGNESNSAAQR
jgi:CubicO group peptidase (beta-lactamase class C family)